MPIRDDRKLSSFLNDASGQFSLEASLTAPMIFLSTVLLMFLAILAYYHAGVYQITALTAERIAYTWDNSFKDPLTGTVALGQNDSLYWRLTDDHISGIFGLITHDNGAKVQLPYSGLATGDGSPEVKLGRAAQNLSHAIEGELTYTNMGFLRKVSMKSTRAVNMPFGSGNRWGSRRMEAAAASYVTDAAEIIRMTELARTFIREIKGRISPSAAAALMKDPAETVKPPVVIASHEQAAAYLRTLVGGKETVMQVNPDTKRVIDALDSSRVAHQAYYTFDEKNLREVQMPKDAALLKQGTQIHGVVWHFFKLSKQDRVKLTQSLKNELERNGIVVIFHE